MSLLRIAAFSANGVGGNPAGIYLCDEFPADEEMQSIAKQVGYSETAFAFAKGDYWRVRYFSPESEVPFCGHATIALGVALTKANGPGTYQLELNDSNISVEGFNNHDSYSAALQSPPTRSNSADAQDVKEALQLFNYSESDLDTNLPPARANAGAEHLIIALNSREKLKAMDYDLAAGKRFMLEHNLVTIMFVFVESEQTFHSRNAFASGGVLEDPATGAASAAFAGYLCDINWPHGGEITIMQGQDMGAPSIIKVNLGNEMGASVKVSGDAHLIK
jgi:PhzF family phenazine biosynthesis protein